ncbi:MAG: hypothetical protein GX234_03775 [Clostridiales bacterium]|nr:hypothetical protein [Clostridiales bacterium]
MKKRLYSITFLALTAIILFCTTQTVLSQSREKQETAIEQQYYEKWEKDYLAQLRSGLEENGYANAGITMTRVSDPENGRSYEVAVHHKRLENLEAGERRKLLGYLSEVSFPVETCSFTFQIF